MYLIGIYPDVELSSSGNALYFNYHANIQITYYSEVEFIVRTAMCPMYIPIGIGGCSGSMRGLYVNEKDEVVGRGDYIKETDQIQFESEKADQYKDRIKKTMAT